MASPDCTDSTPDARRLDYGEDPVEDIILDSDVWERLPEHLIEMIVAKLPFSNLVRFSSVCTRWRDLILSSKISPGCSSDHGWLFYFSTFYDEHLNVFNLSTGTWEIAPLEFLEKQFSLLDVVASAGGLLCFCTRIYGEFIICNPITKCYKRLQMPWGEAWEVNEQPCMLKRFSDNDEIESLDLLVGMILDPDTGHFQLIVGSIYPSLRGTALLYDSSNDSWKKVGNIPEGAHLARSRPISCGRNIYFFFGYTLNGSRILKYDSGEQSWSWIPIPEPGGFSSTIIEQRGKIVLVTALSENLEKVECLELNESPPLKWLPATPLNMSRVCDASPDIKIDDLLGQGDAMFLTLLRTSGTSDLENGEIRVGFQDASTSFDFLSDWEDSGFEDEESPRCQIFKPSMLLIK